MWSAVTRLAGNPKVLSLLGKAKNFAAPIITKAKPIVSRLGVPAAVGTVTGGIRGAQEGGLGGAITGGLGGGGTGMLLGSIPGVGGLNPYLQTGIGLGGGLFGHGVPSNVAPRVGGAVVQNMQNQPNVSGQYIGGGGGAVPPLGGVHGQMVQGPGGTIWQQIDPSGLPAGMRVGSGLDTQQQISNQNRWFQSRFPQSEMVKKADFERELAAKQLGENIEMARKMQEASQANVLNIGEQAGRDMGQLLNNRYQYF